MSKTGQNSGTQNGTSRARALSYGEGCPDVPGDTSRAGQGQHLPGTGTRPTLTVGTSPSRDAKLADIRLRFGTILAGMSAEAQKRFEEELMR